MDPRRGQGFGWTVAVAASSGRRAEDPCPEVEAAARHVESLWGSFFPEAGGYAVSRASLPGAGLRLAVRRGDFCGEVEVGRARPRAALLKVHGRACSQRLEIAERRAARAIDRLRVGGSVIGVSLLLTWMCQLFVYPPGFTIDMLFLLGGLLVVVVLIIALATGANLGAWLGEQFAALEWGRAMAAVEGDAALRGDLQRWRALVRSLAVYREALAGAGRRQPFRAMIADP